MWQTINRTFKEINKQHDMICIEEVKAITLCRTYPKDEYDELEYWLNFVMGSQLLRSNYFKTEEEALKFRNEIMGWNNDK